MKLTSVRITNFRSIRDSGDFGITDITCLVGKNEAGKTALLHALYRLNPIIPKDGMYSLDNDYPRSEIENYRIELEAGKTTPAIVVTALFLLDQNDLIPVQKDFGENILDNANLILEKGYENKIIPSLTVNRTGDLLNR